MKHVNDRTRGLQPIHGFTLIELLVVVAIIAVLIAMLLPALGSARNQAKNLTCKTQVKQLGTAMMMYANENRDFYPVPSLNWQYYFSWGVRGVSGGVPYAFESSQVHDPLMPYIPDAVYDKLVVCPFVSWEMVRPNHVPSNRPVTSRDYTSPPSDGSIKDSCYFYRGYNWECGPLVGGSECKPIRIGDNLTESTNLSNWLICDEERYALSFLRSFGYHHKPLGGNFFFTDGSVRFRPFSPGNDVSLWRRSIVWPEY
jgi:prepilin-type N-terminal cleavage/methylation domain-containing protein